MKITKMEIDGIMYKVTETKSGDTYCEECDLNDKCKRKKEEVFPCNVIGEEEVLIYDTDIRTNS